MRLKRLEIQGFKSFPDRTVFKFQSDGLTAVVGPNGCGKSNLVDAVRWALGEQSAKLLRGQMMEDVIFNGSDKRKPAGMAEVTLVFKNDGLLQNQWREYSEISISRQLFRTGESEYLINGVSCRLKDIRELIADAGGSSRGYSIVEQGRISLLINSKPEEKRALIEEAAGVLKYRMRRLEAERKMERTGQNLLRVSDVIREVQRQLNSMKRSAAKARRYRQLRDELSGLDLRLRYEDFKSLQTSLADLEGQLDAKRSELMDLENRLSAVESRESAVRSELVVGEAKITEGFEAVRKAESDIARIESEISVGEAAVESLEERIERIREEESDLEKQTESDRSELVQLELELASIEDEHEKYASQLEEAQKEFDSVEARLSEVRSCMEKNRNELFVLGSDRNRLEMEVESSKRSREGLERRRSDTLRRLSEIRDGLNIFEENRIIKEEEVRKAEEDVKITAAEIASLREEANLSKEFAVETDTTLAELLEKQAEVRGLRKTLVALEDQMEGLPDGVRHVMKDYAETGQTGVLGVVADHLDVPQQYEKAVLAVLGEKLDHIIVDGPECGQSAVDYLKKQSGGRGSFIPRAPRSNGNGSRNLDQVADDGVIGPLVDLVGFSDPLDGVEDFLLGGTLLVKNLEYAVDLWRRNGFSATMVTLEGDVLEPTGVISGGSEDSEETPLARKRKIRELDLEGKRNEVELQIAKKKRQELSESISSNEEILIRLEEKARKAERTFIECESSLSAMTRDMEQVRNTEGDLTSELELIDLEYRELGEAIESDLVKIAGLKADEESMREQMAVMEGSIPGLTVSVQESREVLENVMIMVKTAGLRRENSQRALQSAENRNRDIEERKARIADERDGALAKIVHHKDLIESGRSRIRDAIGILEQKRHSLEEMRKEQDGAREHAEKLAGEAREYRAKMSGLREEASGIDIRIHELKSEKQHIAERVLEEHQLNVGDLSDAAFEGSGFDRDHTQERISILREKIVKMGEVNPGAVEEFEELNQRFEFLSTQKADLEASMEALAKAIRKINRTSRERFLETFNQVSENFSMLFPRLFEGGSAEMILLDENDPLNTGVEVQVRLPGKRLKSMQLLSGGEKALVSLTMILSMFLTKPSPVCILDEVDAPLDDENLATFSAIIREMSESYQFLVITHSKLTMESADVLYGITMREPGASQVVSVRMKDVA